MLRPKITKIGQKKTKIGQKKGGRGRLAPPPPPGSATGYQYGTLLRPPESHRSITGRYRGSTDINEAIPEYCRCSSVARSGIASAEIFKHVQKFLPSPAVANFVADVLPMCYRSYRCDTVARPWSIGLCTKRA